MESVVPSSILSLFGEVLSIASEEVSIAVLVSVLNCPDDLAFSSARTMK